MAIVTTAGTFALIIILWKMAIDCWNKFKLEYSGHSGISGNEQDSAAKEA